MPPSVLRVVVRRVVPARLHECPKVLNSTEGAHMKNMSAFEADEHLQELTPPPSAEVESAG
jgi:hypothetical protein